MSNSADEGSDYEEQQQTMMLHPTLGPRPDPMHAESVKLRACVRVNVIQRMYNGFVASFKEVKSSPASMIDHWAQTVPGFRDRLDEYALQRANQKDTCRGKWSLRNLQATDKNRIIDMFQDQSAYVGDDCEFTGPNMLDMYTTCAIFLYSRPKHSLPKPKNADQFGLWVGFQELLPDTAADVISNAEDHERQQADKKRKKRPGACDEQEGAIVMRAAETPATLDLVELESRVTQLEALVMQQQQQQQQQQQEQESPLRKRRRIRRVSV